MRLEETLEYRCYLCLASTLGTLSSDNLGSDGAYDDSDYYVAHINELFGAEIDKVFASQHVDGVFGKKRWAFADPSTGFRGHDLEARLFYDRNHDVYYLVNRPTETRDDMINNAMTVIGAGIPDKFQQAAQLVELVRPEFRDKIVLTGLSLGGALSAYAALKASWPVRAVVFDPLGLNRKMMGARGLGVFGQGEVLSDRFRSMNDTVDWYYIANSWVADLNVKRHLSSVGKVTELPQDPARALNNSDTHDFRHVRFGLHRLWGASPGDDESRDDGQRDDDSDGCEILVPEAVPLLAGASPSTMWAALQAAAVPVAVEYLPVSKTEMTRYRTVPVNAAAQQAMVDLVGAVGPDGPALFRVILPQGAELTRAVGGGFRGFAKGGGGKISAQAVLKPVGTAGALAAAWPVLAVAGTVMALDMLAQREQRAHQRKVEAILGRMEERYYVDRIKDQRSADAQLTRVISLILDGDNPPLELAVKGADDVFHRSLVWLEKYEGVVGRLIGRDGKVDYEQLRGELGGDLPDFFRELHLARAAIAIRRKALLADAAAKSLADPSNAYTSFRRFLESQADQLEMSDRIAVDLSQSLAEIQIRGGWPDSPKKVQGQEQLIRSMAATPTVGPNPEVQFLLDSAGEIRQVLPSPDNLG